MSLADSLANVVWRTSSYSSSNGGNCVQVGFGLPGAIPVRDSKRTEGPMLVVNASSWVDFVAFAVRHSR